MKIWLVYPFLLVSVAALGSMVSEYDQIMLCNSSVDQANASGAFQFSSPLDWGNVGDPSWAVTVAQWNNTTQRTTWYNTAARNYSNDLHLGFDACAYSIAGLPLNTIELGQDDPGDCSSVLSQSCRDAIVESTSNIATGLTYTATPPPYSNLSAGSLPYICNDILNSSPLGGNWPKECEAELGIDPSAGKYGKVDLIDIGALTGFNDSIMNSSCTLTSGNLTYHQVTTFESADTAAAYNNATRTIQPILTVFMPVANVDRIYTNGGYGRANSSFQCVLANQHYYHGSRVSAALPSGTPYSSGSKLSGGAIAGIVVGVVVASILLALGIFLYVRSKRRIARAKLQKKEIEVDSESKARSKPGELADGTVLELDSTNRKNEADGMELSELPGHHERASELSGQGKVSELGRNERRPQLSDEDVRAELEG